MGRGRRIVPGPAKKSPTASEFPPEQSNGGKPSMECLSCELVSAAGSTYGHRLSTGWWRDSSRVKGCLCPTRIRAIKCADPPCNPKNAAWHPSAYHK